MSFLIIKVHLLGVTRGVTYSRNVANFISLTKQPFFRNYYGAHNPFALYILNFGQLWNDVNATDFKFFNMQDFANLL